MPNTPIHFAKPSRAERGVDPRRVGSADDAVEALSTRRLQLAQAAMTFNAIYMQLSGNDVDGVVERVQACVDLAMDRVDEMVRDCVADTQVR